MKRNIVGPRLATFMAAALVVGLLATGAQARGGSGGHGGGFGGFQGGGFHGGMMTGRSAFVAGSSRLHLHDHVYGCYVPPYGSLNGWDQQYGCY
jgi:hypothetical protein